MNDSRKRAASCIEPFLKRTGDAAIVAAVPEVGVLGLAWLAKRTEGRAVTVIAAKVAPVMFKRGANDHRRQVLAWIEQPSVAVTAWEPPPKASLHPSLAAMSLWVAYDPMSGLPTDALAGSAALTQAGLHESIELVAAADPNEVSEVLARIRLSVVDASEAVRDGVTTYMRAGEGHYDPTAAVNRGSNDASRLRAARAVASTAWRAKSIGRRLLRRG